MHDKKSPLKKGDRGGCKIVLVKMGNSQGKTQPPESPFVKGDLSGLQGGMDYSPLRRRLHNSPLGRGWGVGLFPSFHEGKGREIAVNISRITALPTPL